MPKRSSTPARDVNQIATGIIQAVTGEEAPKTGAEKNPAAVALGRLGGKKGGKARAAKLTPEQRTEIARAAAAARWKKSR